MRSRISYHTTDLCPLNVASISANGVTQFEVRPGSDAARFEVSSSINEVTRAILNFYNFFHDKISSTKIRKCV